MKKIITIALIVAVMFAVVSCGESAEDKFYFEHDAFSMIKLPNWYQTENIENEDGSFDAFFERKSIRNNIFENVRFNVYADTDIITIDDKELTLPEMMDNMKVFFETTEDMESYKIDGKKFDRFKFVSYPEDGEVPYNVTLHSAEVNGDLFIITTGTYTTQPVDVVYTENILEMLESIKLKNIKKE